MSNTGGKGGPEPPPPYLIEPPTYSISFHLVARDVACLVVDCPGRVKSRASLRVHVVHHHVRYTIVVLEEGNNILTQCPHCDMFPP